MKSTLPAQGGVMGGVLGSNDMKMGGNGISGGRKRRDDNSEGYGKQYQSTEGVFSAAFLAPFASQMAPLITSTEMKETIGSPLVFAGLSIGLLLVVIMLSLAEYVLVKRGGGDEDGTDGDTSNVKYENVNLA